MVSLFVSELTQNSGFEEKKRQNAENREEEEHVEQHKGFFWNPWTQTQTQQQQVQEVQKVVWRRGLQTPTIPSQQKITMPRQLLVVPLKKLRKTVRELNSSPQEASICNPTISPCTNLCKQESSIIIKHSEHFVENEEQQVVKSEFQKFSSGAVNNSLTDQDTKLTSADNSQERGCQVLATSDSDDTQN